MPALQAAQTPTRMPTSSPGNWPLPEGDQSWMTSFSARLGPLDPCPPASACLIKTCSLGPERPESSPAPRVWCSRPEVDPPPQNDQAPRPQSPHRMQWLPFGLCLSVCSTLPTGRAGADPQWLPTR